MLNWFTYTINSFDCKIILKYLKCINFFYSTMYNGKQSSSEHSLEQSKNYYPITRNCRNIQNKRLL